MHELASHLGSEYVIDSVRIVMWTIIHPTDRSNYYLYEFPVEDMGNIIEYKF